MILPEEIIRTLDLKPHPEGGYYKEEYRSPEILNNGLPARYKGDRNFATAIYFMLNQGQISHWHKVQSDETWHHYLGTSIKLHMLSPLGHYSIVNVGKDILKGEKFQFTIPAQHWFAGELLDKSQFGLFGCTVAPGFDFLDFQLANFQDIQKLNADLANARLDLILNQEISY